MLKNKKRLMNFIETRKILSAFILVIVFGLGYWVYSKYFKPAIPSSYMVTNVRKGNVISTISGTGQVSAASQLDIKSKVSGDLAYLNKEANGTEITKGTLIAQVDTRDASLALESAKIAYAKLVKPADESTIIQSESALNDAISNSQKAYEDGLNTLNSTYAVLPTVFKGVNDLLNSQTGYLNTEKIRPVSQTALDYQAKAVASYDLARNSYDTILAQYKAISRNSSTTTVSSFIKTTYEFTKLVSEAVKNTQTTLVYVTQQRNDTTGTTDLANVSSWSNSINTQLSNLLSAKTALDSSDPLIAQKRADLIKVRNGADELDIDSQNINLQQAQNTYDNYFIRAPFDGLLARLSVRATDSVSAGTVIGTLVSTKKITIITLNEVDVEKVKVGQKAKLTFDAIDGLRVDGTVTTVDLVGTVTSGVVNYNVEISLDTQDDRVKSGMSVTASIITNEKQDILVVPNSAVKTQGKNIYVEMFTTPLTVVKGSTSGTVSNVAPTQKKVEVGISNDTITEIVSGLNEGDQVVTRTISSTTAKTTAAATPSLFGNTGGGGTRIPRN